MQNPQPKPLPYAIVQRIAVVTGRDPRTVQRVDRGLPVWPHHEAEIAPHVDRARRGLPVAL